MPFRAILVSSFAGTTGGPLKSIILSCHNAGVAAIAAAEGILHFTGFARELQCEYGLARALEFGQSTRYDKMSHIARTFMQATAA